MNTNGMWADCDVDIKKIR